MRRSRELDNTTPCRFRHVALEASMRAAVLTSTASPGTIAPGNTKH